jgi:4-hydroxy-tetrahydrodipicolinate reductase
MNIFVVGSGKLARAILTYIESNTLYTISKWGELSQMPDEAAILVHAGSGRQVDECLNFCSRTKSVFIELATGLGTEKKEYDFPYILCPNTSILVLKTLHLFKTRRGYFDGFNISITESHQSSKETEPGTAYDFAGSLKLPLNKVVSIRDPEIQRNEIGIPEEYMSKHAYHRIVITDEDDEIVVQTKVLGHKSYAKGVRKMVEAILQNKLENRNYTVWELIDRNII